MFAKNNFLPKRSKNQSGQALLIVLLVMAVVLTVALSSVSRSVSDISTSEIEEDSSRAFSAAEAGIEQALLNPPLAGETSNYTVGDATASVSAELQDPTGGGDRYPEKLENGEELVIWLVEHDISTGKINCDSGDCYTHSGINKLCWGDDDRTYTSGTDSNAPALLLTLYYDDNEPTPLWRSGNYSNIKIASKGFDPISDRAAVNGFKQPVGSCNIGGNHYPYGVSVDFDDNDAFDFDTNCSAEGCLIMLKIRMLYNDYDKPEEIAYAFVSQPQLPPQGIGIDSTGVLGDTQRKVQVFKSFPEPLDILSVAVFSKDGLSK